MSSWPLVWFFIYSFVHFLKKSADDRVLINSYCLWAHLGSLVKMLLMLQELFNIKSFPPMDLQSWVKAHTKRPDFIKLIPKSLFDLVDKCLTVNPRQRITADEALKHEFFNPCYERLRKQKMLRRGSSSNSADVLGEREAILGVIWAFKMSTQFSWLWYSMLLALILYMSLDDDIECMFMSLC